MIDDGLYDYYGIDQRTHQDYECIERMENALRDLSPNHLIEADYKLLEEYASKLFRTLPPEIDLYEAISELVKMVSVYRFQVGYQANIDNELKQLSKKRKNESRDDKIEAFQKHIKKIIDIMGDTPKTNYSGGGKERELLYQVLKKALNNPNNYILGRSICMMRNKNAIKDYLFSLRLTSRTKFIEDFIKKIK